MRARLSKAASSAAALGRRLPRARHLGGRLQVSRASGRPSAGFATRRPRSFGGKKAAPPAPVAPPAKPGFAFRPSPRPPPSRRLPSSEPRRSPCRLISRARRAPPQLRRQGGAHGLQGGGAQESRRARAGRQHARLARPDVPAPRPAQLSPPGTRRRSRRTVVLFLRARRRPPLGPTASSSPSATMRASRRASRRARRRSPPSRTSSCPRRTSSSSRARRRPARSSRA
ncbi:hypothetical protein M885DRAFT_539831 [Pelagophyceae sp. CCMP2097]|nr:hypothetical protein M885DRAFT_539831 [Pelagophyceae sp. CCMP2097]